MSFLIFLVFRSSGNGYRMVWCVGSLASYKYLIRSWAVIMFSLSHSIVFNRFFFSLNQSVSFDRRRSFSIFSMSW